MTDPSNAFSKMVPGFDFLQGLMKNAGAAMPGVGQWIAPTLDPEELDKRIKDLRTVQFWLEQNARMMGATIQALEVQRMTLSTLQTMNVSMGDLSESLKLRMPGAAAAEAPAATAASMAANMFRAPTPAAAPAPAPEPAAAPVTADAPAVPAGVIDPMQWWGALTQQFSQLAAQALKNTPTDSARNLADALQQGMDTAGATIKKATEAPLAAVQKMATAAASLNSLGGGAQATGAASAKAGAASRAKAATVKPRSAKPAARGSAK